jgi:hypothetical protein
MGSKKGSGVPDQWFLKEVLGRFVERSPVTVMVQAVMENVFAAEPVDALFKDAAERQYTKQLLFSSLVDLMSTVVCGKWPSVRAAYEAIQDRIPVTLAAVYQKLNGVEPQVSAALVRDVAQRLRKVIEKMGGQLPDLLPGYSLRILDGNHLAATDRRIKVLRRSAAGPLPGFGLVVLDPAAMLVEDMIPCEDGHAQERSLTKEILALVRPGQAWLDDRNFCTMRLLFGIAEKKSCFITRQHATNLRWEPAGARKRIGRCSTGVVYEQRILLTNDDGDTLFARRITVALDDYTRDGDSELHIVTNLPRRISAVQVAELYRKRWTLETVFQELAATLNGEINTLCYPKAALFAFAVALVAFNALSAVKAALRAVHGHERIQKKFSDYYLAIQLRATHEGMMIAVPDAAWDSYRNFTPAALAKELTQLAAHVRLSAFPKAPTVARRRPLARLRYRGKTHISTGRLLAAQPAARRAP